jgi:peptidyl-prolyl cis-trans isomerase A (cyclophilin A)
MRKVLAVILLLVPSLLLAADAAGNPKAVIETTMGNFNCVLFPDKAPKGVANFIGLADGSKDWTNPVSHVKKHNSPLYDGTIFHRVIPGFMIQGGDPAGNGSGDPGYGFGIEVTPDLKFDGPGRLAYARTDDPNSQGSQFFITDGAAPHLNGKYTIFGQCEPASLVSKIAKMPRDPNNNRPFQPVKITRIKIVQPRAAAPTAEKKTEPKK